MSTSNMTSSSFAGFIDSRARQPVALRFLTLVLTACLGIFIVILLFMAVWGVLYRLPHSAPGLVDLRSGKGNPRYVLLCCGLANNAHGFPGHCYVAWSSSQLSDLDHIEAKGYVPRYAMDQITSLFRDVPGLVLANASQGNLRNFDAVVAIVDQSTFDKTRELGLVWSQDRFRVGERDCVAYTDAVARCIGLRTPDRHYRYPQNYIAELKKMNCRKTFFIGKHRPSV